MMVDSPAAAAVAARTEEALARTEALLEGHFLLSSGRHAGRYVQCAQLLQHPEEASRACADLASLLREQHRSERPFDVVVGPAMGAVTFSYELGRALGVRAVFAERAPEGGFTLRRGFTVVPGERVLVAEDVVTTGKSAGEVVTMLRAMGVESLAAASIVNRSGGPSPFGALPYMACLSLDVPSWEPEDCPLCASGEHGPAVKPGSRPGL